MFPAHKRICSTPNEKKTAPNDPFLSYALCLSDEYCLFQEDGSFVYISEPNINSSLDIPSSTTVSEQCKICGARNLCSNFGVITCDSCRIFFKRNAKRDQNKIPCQYNGNCEININTRHVCSSCRLVKCFANGMQSDLIRSHRSKKNRVEISEEDKQQKLPTLNLLQPDNSTLTKDQRIVLSNAVYSYNERKLISIAEQFMNESDVLQSLRTIDLTLPKKFFMEAYKTSEEYLQSNEDLYTLSFDDRSDFLRNAAENVTCLGTIFCWNWSQIYNYKPFLQVVEKVYGHSLLPLIQHLLKFIDPDIAIAKLTLPLFAFSNNISIFSSNIKTKFTNTFEIFRIQNIYVEVMWRYLLYKYGYYQSIQRFINLIQCLLAATDVIFEAQNIEQHVNDIELLVERTELTLVLDDMDRMDYN